MNWPSYEFAKTTASPAFRILLKRPVAGSYHEWSVTTYDSGAAASFN